MSRFPPEPRGAIKTAANEPPPPPSELPLVVVLSSLPSQIVSSDYLLLFPLGFSPWILAPAIPAADPLAEQRSPPHDDPPPPPCAMPWWKNGGNRSPPSPPPEMSAFSKLPQLTRQRKLRYLRDDEVQGLGTAENPVSRSQSTRENAHPRLSTSVPQPLPLPDARDGRRNPPPGRRTGSADSGEGNVHGNRHVNLTPLLVEPIGERFYPPAVMGSRLSQPTILKSPDHADDPLVGSSFAFRKSGCHEGYLSEDIHLRFNGQDRSTISSGLSSPGFSPRRLSTGDFIPSPYMPYHIPQMWSAPEIRSTDYIAANLPMDRGSVSHDRSVYSPKGKSPGPKSTNPSAPCSPLHSKMFTENSPVRLDNYGNAVHPLPLPPVPGPPSVHPSFPHHITKVEPPSMPNQWQKGKLIGSGTFGNVFIATNRHTGALCAMKEVNLIPDDPKSAECIKQLQQEIKLLSQLKHPNIVQYYGSEIIEDRFYIYLEYVYPGSINKYVNEHCGAVTESVVRSFTRHILRGLAYLHSTKTMHRDIKGANLLVDSCGVVKLADFGMAKHLSGAKDELSMRGTPYWMAPEVLQATMNKELSYDFSVDIWSLGCTIIEMFTGKHPWSGFESAAAMFKILQESPHIPETLSTEGKDFLELCFRRNPTERPAAGQLLEHPFVVHTIQHNSTQPCSGGIRFSDVSHGLKNTRFACDSTMKGKYSFNGYSGI